jgi:hypothetical protein
VASYWIDIRAWHAECALETGDIKSSVGNLTWVVSFSNEINTDALLFKLLLHTFYSTANAYLPTILFPTSGITSAYEHSQAMLTQTLERSKKPSTFSHHHRYLNLTFHFLSRKLEAAKLAHPDKGGSETKKTRSPQRIFLQSWTQKIVRSWSVQLVWPVALCRMKMTSMRYASSFVFCDEPY